MRRSRTSTGLLALVLVVSACSGSETSTTTSGTSSGETQPTGPSGTTSTTPQEDLGWFSIDGNQIQATSVDLCGTAIGQETPGEFRLGIAGRDDGELVQILVDYNWLADDLAAEAPYRARVGVEHDTREPGGTRMAIFGALELKDGEDVWIDANSGETRSLTLNGGRISSGPVTLQSSFTEDHDITVVIGFDVGIPDRASAGC